MADRIQLVCEDCGHTVMRSDVDPYTGHMFDWKQVYLCSECTGIMRDKTHLLGAVCECDKVLREIEHGAC